MRMRREKDDARGKILNINERSGSYNLRGDTEEVELCKINRHECKSKLGYIHK